MDYRPITRYDVAGGYLNLPGLAQVPDAYPQTRSDPPTVKEDRP